MLFPPTKATAEKQLTFRKGMNKQIKEVAPRYTKASQKIREKLCRARNKETKSRHNVTQMKEIYCPAYCNALRYLIENPSFSADILQVLVIR